MLIEVQVVMGFPPSVLRHPLHTFKVMIGHLFVRHPLKMDKATVRVLSNKLVKLLLQFLLSSHLIQLREQLLTFSNGVPIKH